MQVLSFKCLLSDPYAYVYRKGGDLKIVTIWINDLLLFITLDEVMENLKGELKSCFELMDIGEPNKIVSIKIFQTNNFNP